MVGVQVNVFSGKEFVPVTISPEMISHYLGEYVITNKRVSHGALELEHLDQSVRSIEVIDYGWIQIRFSKF